MPKFVGLCQTAMSTPNKFRSLILSNICVLTDPNREKDKVLQHKAARQKITLQTYGATSKVNKKGNKILVQVKQI